MQTDAIAVLIPLSGIILGISAGIVAIVSRHRQMLQRADLRHKERLVAMEKGLELPPEIMDADVRRPRFLLRGLVWTFVGVAAFFALRSVAGTEESMLAGVPFAVGLAYLIYYFVEGRKEAAQSAPKEPAG
jgi:uncharacterized membrane protein YeiB